MNYDKAAFDRENMAYPDGQWTFAEFMDAVKQLTVKDTNGNVTAAGFANSGRIFREAFWRSLMDADAVDATSLPNQPQFTRPDIEAVLDGYHQLEQQGLINGDANTAAMFIDSARKMPPDGHGWALLPGNKAVLLPFGLAISAGTQHPDLAYDLVKYLSGQNLMYGSLPARKSLTEANGVGSMVLPDWQPLIEAGFTNSLTYSNLRFSDYLNAAWGAADGSTSTHDLLQTLEARAISDLRTADAKRETVVISVTEPTPPTVPEGKIALNFDMVRAKQTQETHDLWERVAQDFASTDPQVGLVNLREMGDPASVSAANSDCFYSASNAVPSIDPTLLLSLDPLLNADASFDHTDLIGNVLTAVQRDGNTLALPLNLNPFILRYDGARFAAANLPEPAATWTVEDFNNALDALKPSSEGHAPFVDNTTGGGYLLVLITSYGGLPLDYRTTPPSVNFTDAATVEAIRQVLDLAKNGSIGYSAVGNFGEGLVAFPNNTTAIYSSMLDGFGRKLPRGAAPDRAAMFPMGRDYNGVAYDLGAGYISAQTQYPEACYRFLQTLSQHPELFASMPVRHSMLDSLAFQATVTPDLLTVYEQMDSLLTDPKTVAFPADSNGGPSVSDFLLQHWLFQAFDSYVLNSGDLDEALANAEQMATTFQTCTADLPPLDPIVDKGGDNSALTPYVDCAEQADASLKPLLDPMVSR